MNIPFVIDYLKWLMICLYLYWSIQDQDIHNKTTLNTKSIYPPKPKIENYY